MVRNRMLDKLATAVLWAAGLCILLILSWFLIRILGKGIPHLTPKFLFGKPEEIVAGGGIGPQIFNSFYILFLSMLFSMPIGIGAGIYLAVYAKANRFTELIRISVEALSSVPSIVFGLFGALLFVNLLGFKFSILAGACTLALLNLPVLVSVTETALRSVPRHYFDASLAMGSTRWQAIWNVLLPAALPVLITGVTLVAGRALGESALLIFTAGTSVSRFFPDFNPLAMGEALAVHIWYANSISLAPDGKQIAEGSSAALVLIVLMINLLIAIPSRWLEKNMAGKK
ncbi:phosphate ABC transporter permease PstA [Paenibacillus sp. y28]|uniref:phosphate ABC transporter permease PstA n=1 Tax=Paenibacillus sp. y28 TaxID=3129110 RepID=UPI00301AE5E9